MNAFTLYLAMTGKLNPKKARRKKGKAEKERLGRVTTQRHNGVTHFSIKLNVPKPRRLVVNSRLRKK